MPDTVIRMRPAMRHQPREIGDRETELRGSGARMTSRIVKPGARREPHGDPQGYRSQIVRNGLFSMTRSESGAQLTERPENGQCGTVRLGIASEFRPRVGQARRMAAISCDGRHAVFCRNGRERFR